MLQLLYGDRFNNCLYLHLNVFIFVTCYEFHCKSYPFSLPFLIYNVSGALALNSRVSTSRLICTSYTFHSILSSSPRCIWWFIKITSIYDFPSYWMKLTCFDSDWCARRLHMNLCPMASQIRRINPAAVFNRHCAGTELWQLCEFIEDKKWRNVCAN